VLAPRIVDVALAAELNPNQELVPAPRNLSRSATERLGDRFHTGDSGARQLIGHRVKAKTSDGFGGKGENVQQLNELTVQHERRTVGVRPKAHVVLRNTSATGRRETFRTHKFCRPSSRRLAGILSLLPRSTIERHTWAKQGSIETQSPFSRHTERYPKIGILCRDFGIQRRPSHVARGNIPDSTTKVPSEPIARPPSSMCVIQLLRISLLSIYRVPMSRFFAPWRLSPRPRCAQL
jgi:hypothetical protein